MSGSSYLKLLEELTKAWDYGGTEGAQAVLLLEREIQAAVELRVAERCAPLVEAAERLLATDGQQVWDAMGYAKARRDLEALLAAYHASTPGAGRGTDG